MIAPGPRSTRRRVAELATVPVPAPRAVFVADLERRLATLSEASMRAAPEVELVPPRRAPRTRLPAVSIVVALLVATVAVASGTFAPERRVHQVRPADGDAAVGRTVGATKASPPVDSAARRPRAASSQPTTIATTTPSESMGEVAMATAPGAAGTFELSAIGSPAHVTLDWERHAGDDFGAYLVLRSTQPGDVDHPDPTGKTSVVARIENRDVRRHSDLPKFGAAPRYRVVVVDHHGAVVARSTIAAPHEEPVDAALRGADLLLYVATS